MRGRCDGVAAEGLSIFNIDLGPGRFFVSVKNNGECNISILFSGGGRLPAAAPGGSGGGVITLPNVQTLILRCDRTEGCPACLATVSIRGLD